MTVVAAKGRLMGESTFSNELDNSLFTMNNYPVWTTFNGYQPSSDATYINQTGTWKTFGYWRHYSPLYNDGYGSYIGNQLLDREASPNGTETQRGDHALLPFLSGSEPRVLKIYGAESLFSSAAVANNDADRGHGTTGEFTNQNNTRVIANTGSSQGGNYITGSIGTGTSMNSTSLWTRYDWTQIVDIPDSATTVKFGAQVKIASDDKLKTYNFAGIYCAEDNYTTNTRVVNYFRLRDSISPYDLATGTLSSAASPYNWSGLTTSGAVDSSGNNLKVFTPASTVANELASLNQNDYEEFKKVEYSFTPQSGTNRKMSFNLFFSESARYLSVAAGDPTGGFQVFDPFVEFS